MVQQLIPIGADVTEAEAKKLLTKNDTALWFRIDGKLIKATPFALWLWKIISTTDTVLPVEKLSSLNILTVFSDNFYRINPFHGGNFVFYTTLAAFVKQHLHDYEGNEGFQNVQNSMLTSPYMSNVAECRRNIYLDAKGEFEGTFLLEIDHPEGSTPLYFQTTIHPVRTNSGLKEYVISYEPTPETQSLIGEDLQKILEIPVYDIIQQKQSSKQGGEQVMSKEQLPRKYVEVTHDQITSKAMLDRAAEVIADARERDLQALSRREDVLPAVRHEAVNKLREFQQERSAWKSTLENRPHAKQKKTPQT